MAHSLFVAMWGQVVVMVEFVVVLGKYQPMSEQYILP